MFGNRLSHRRDPVLPGDPAGARLMLFAAMYVEENGILDAIDANVPAGAAEAELEPVLVEGYCRLDMNMEGQEPGEVRALLADAWGIADAAGLLAVLDRLLAGAAGEEDRRGWDLARRIHLIRLGFLARLLAPAEAWVLVGRQREPACAAFASWPAVAASFRAGCRARNGGDHPLDAACGRLLAHARSPWLRLGWLA